MFICGGLVYYGEDVQLMDLALFSGGLILFMMGMISQALIISSFFNKSSLATQLGSLLILFPVAFTIYLKVNFFKENLEKFRLDNFEQI